MSEHFGAVITSEVAAAADVLTQDHAIVEEEADCPTCGESFEVGQQALHVYEPAFDQGRFRAVLDIHLRCYQGEEVAP